jgi:hypothetical protein
VSKFLSVKLRSGRTILVRRKGPSRSKYFHGVVRRRERFLSEKGNQMFIHKKDGYAAELLSQDAESKVTYSQDGAAPITVPSHVFFTEFREATGEEIAPPSEEKPVE